MSEPIQPPPKLVQNTVFGAILILLFLLVCRLLSYFFSVLLWSILFYILLGPLHQRIIRNMDFSTYRGKIVKNILAGVFSLGTIFLILIPLVFVSFQFYRQITDLIRSARDFLYGNPGIFSDSLIQVSDLIADMSSGLVVIDPGDLRVRLIQFLSQSLQGVLQASSAVARNVGAFGAGIVFMLFCLFFFYLDGPYLARLVKHAIPIRKEYMSALITKFKDITRNLFLGYIIVALVQAVMGYIIFSIFRVKGSLVFAALVLICAFVPMFGAGLVWFPLGVIRIVSGRTIEGIVFLAVSGFFISLLDNFLRPVFLQNRIQLHPLIIFLAILGGVSSFGFNGLILGPMIVILFLTVLDLFLTEHSINFE
ncbi:MAG: AI-2E family transporter [Spirochaetaceae bacterium]|jgi:predicted PurR-regulated permease PerM|nr:AI-2E family transporter [Spirochaetaceae bacterium]